jgi:DNA-binding SARP family transcriptional activator
MKAGADGQGIELGVLGPFRLRLGGGPVAVGCGSKLECLIVRLALARRGRRRRDDLLDHLWPRSDACLARQSLNSLTSHVNRLARPHLGGADLIQHEGGYYQLCRTEPVRIDADVFDRLAHRGLQWLRYGDRQAGLGAASSAIRLYRGDLAGDDELDTVLERERLRMAYQELLFAVAATRFAAGEYPAAVDVARRLLREDPCREDAHRLVMRSLAEMGLRSQALRQYRLCSRALADEYDAVPEAATNELYAAIRRDRVAVSFV